MGIIAIVIGYLLGSVPSAYIAARLVKGKDIRQMGAGNVGAVNTFKWEKELASLSCWLMWLRGRPAQTAVAHLVTTGLWPLPPLG